MRNWLMLERILLLAVTSATTSGSKYDYARTDAEAATVDRGMNIDARMVVTSRWVLQEQYGRETTAQRHNMRLRCSTAKRCDITCTEVAKEGGAHEFISDIGTQYFLGEVEQAVCMLDDRADLACCEHAIGSHKL